MRYNAKFVIAAFVLSLGVTLIGCSPAVKYPSCAKDEDCKANSEGAPVTEYCVNQRCQQCREDGDCEAEGAKTGGYAHGLATVANPLLSARAEYGR